ncbi:acyl-CoA dehydrogenase/oxidase [Chytriomyces sp. MP71]|nr:acyl-CoA dehydrogenase/oxidase [Chytriomyces sp. MP71]
MESAAIGNRLAKQPMGMSLVLNDEEWQSQFRAAIADVGDGMSYAEAARRLRAVVGTGLLKLDDIRARPSRFFLAHRLLAAHATRLGPGFFIRFTVHFNLFAGTVVALGTDQQLADLIARNAATPRLGCFALTERLAGVNSGLVVDTTATFHKESGTFVIESPHKGAGKNWISQGLVADDAVVVATLTVNGKSYGPQAFLVPLRDTNGNLLPGVTATDMGRKTVGNDLDNASLEFKNFSIPRSALLARYLRVEPDGSVVLPAGNKRTMDMIGQRLFTGRVAVAQAALQFSRGLFASTRSFAQAKECWAPQGRTRLFDVPQIKDIFARADTQLGYLDAFVAEVEKQLSVCLMQGAIPPVKLQQAIAVCKVKGLDVSIALCHALKQEVGSYALMAGTGFEQLDFLQCCKFAEGDSRILMQKMARDAFRTGKATSGHPAEAAALDALKAALVKHKGNKNAWDMCWREVYALAESHMEGVLAGYGVRARL